MRDLQLSLVLLFTIMTSAIFAQTINTNVVSPDLLAQIEKHPDQEFGFYILLQDRIDAQAWSNRFNTQKTSLEERAATLIPALKNKAATTQKSILEFLQTTEGIDVNSIRPFWITNLIYAKGTGHAIGLISRNDKIELIEPELDVFKVDDHAERIAAPLSQNGRENGLTAIKAHKLWEKGYSGNGQIAMIVDTGTDYDHPALRNNYRGLYVDESQTYTGSDEHPSDCDGHGTHVAGTICGLDRTNNDTIGVAFNALWISGPLNLGTDCDNFAFGGIDNFEWAIDPDGNPNTIDDMPAAINNSWGSDGGFCGNNGGLGNTLEAMEAVGIAMIWAAGNDGPNPVTTIFQADINNTLVNNFAVGALDGNSIDLGVTSFSSRGPSTCSGTGSIKIKPEVSAPGYNVRSCNHIGGYMTISGTSMASPHVAGAIVLLKEAFPYLTGEQLKYALYFSANDLGEPGEDNVYGMGIINLEDAFNYLVDEGHVPADPIRENDLMLVDVDVENLNCNGPTTWSILVENGGTTPVNQFNINYKILLKGAIREEATVSWNGNLLPGERSVYNLPDLTNIAGLFDVEVSIQSSDPSITDNQPFNNLINRRNILILEEIAIEAKLIPEGSSPCNYTTPLLFVDVPDAVSIDWYLQNTGGTSVHKGAYYLSFPLAGGFTFYVEATLAAQGGIETPENGILDNANNGLSFDANMAFTLKSVTVFAETPGFRTIGLYDKNNNLRTSTTIDIQNTGPTVVNFDFSVPKGKDFELRLIDGAALMMNMNGDFPYSLGGVVFINQAANAAASQDAYFYFYDWVIEHPQACGRQPLEIIVQDSEVAPYADFTPSATLVSVTALEQVEFTNTSSNSSSYLWDFGDGTTSTDENPFHNYSEPGLYTVVLSAIGPDGCSDSETVEIEAVLETAIPFAATKDQIKLFPNPTSQFVQIQFEFTESQSLSISVVDVLGRQLEYIEKANVQNEQLQINVANFSEGIYYIIFEKDQEKIVKKLVKL